MDLTEQNKFSEELAEFLDRKLKDKEFHCVIAIEATKSSGFAFNLTTLSEESRYHTLDRVMGGINEETKTLTETFKLPSDRKTNKPVEPKW